MTRQWRTGLTGIGDWDEQRPVKAFTVWRSQFSDTSGAGKDNVRRGCGSPWVTPLILRKAGTEVKWRYAAAVVVGCSLCRDPSAGMSVDQLK